MSTVILYWTILFASYIIATRLRPYRHYFSSLPGITMGIVYIIVLLMGIRMGANQSIIHHLKTIGFQALVITIFCVSGSMIAVWGLRMLIGMNRFGDLHKKAEKPYPGSGVYGIQKGSQKSDHFFALKNSLTILGFVILGITIGIFLLHWQPEYCRTKLDHISNTVTSALLFIMIALVGFDLGLSEKIGLHFKNIGVLAFFFPLAAIIGSLAMGALSGCLLGFSVKEGLAISAGFGWYTYAPTIIANAGPDYLITSAVAFLYNMIRETVSIVLLPVFAKHIGYLEAISMPGISAMDICMPIIERSCRQDTVIYAFLMGFIMNIVTSIGVPLIMQF